MHIIFLFIKKKMKLYALIHSIENRIMLIQIHIYIYLQNFFFNDFIVLLFC